MFARICDLVLLVSCEFEYSQSLHLVRIACGLATTEKRVIPDLDGITRCLCEPLGCWDRCNTRLQMLEQVLMIKHTLTRVSKWYRPAALLHDQYGMQSSSIVENTWHYQFTRDLRRSGQPMELYSLQFRYIKKRSSVCMQMDQGTNFLLPSTLSRSCMLHSLKAKVKISGNDTQTKQIVLIIWAKVVEILHLWMTDRPIIAPKWMHSI